MKNLMKAVAVVSIIGASAVTTIVSAGETLQIAQQTVEKKVTFTIEKMTCAMCPITVRKAMEKVAGVVSVETDYESKTAVVVFDPAKATVDVIAKASTDAGYPALLTEHQGS